MTSNLPVGLEDSERRHVHHTILYHSQQAISDAVVNHPNGCVARAAYLRLESFHAERDEPSAQQSIPIYSLPLTG